MDETEKKCLSHVCLLFSSSSAGHRHDELLQRPFRRHRFDGDDDDDGSAVGRQHPVDFATLFSGGSLRGHKIPQMMMMTRHHAPRRFIVVVSTAVHGVIDGGLCNEQF